jgi:hypothetical protein
MSGVARFLGKVSGILAVVTAPINPIISAAFSANAMIMGAIGGKKKPTVLGSVTNITIGANMPSPQIIGNDVYYGGSRVTQTAFGEEDKVPNAHALFIDVYSVGGPLAARTGIFADFNPVTFTGTNADGYFHNNLHFVGQLGETPESGYLGGHWGDGTDWGSAYKLSGMAAAAWSARWPKDGKVFAAGFPQTGTTHNGVLDYDPRQDSTYPGGSGSHRWAEPGDKVAFAAAKATWDHGVGCPGRAGLRYALGTWERDETDSDADYVQTFGMGLSLDGIVVEDFVELANVCDANGWTASGVLFEPGEGVCWANLKRIVGAGGAEPIWKGGRLGLKIRAPRVSLDTISHDDLAGRITAAAMQGYRDRPNTLIPMHRDAGQKYEMAPGSPIQVLDYVAADGEERQDTSSWEFVDNADQAAQLTGYDLVDGREQIAELVLKSRARRFLPGEKYTLTDALAADLALDQTDVVILTRQVDPRTMTVTLTVMTDTPAKHTFALGLTGTSPPALTILSPEDIDGAIGSQPGLLAALIRNAYFTIDPLDSLLVATDSGGFGPVVTVADQSWQYPNAPAVLVRDGGVISGLDNSTKYFVYFDDATLADSTPSYAATIVAADAVNSADHPDRHFLGEVTTPAPGGGPTDGGGWGGGYPGRELTTPL